AAGWALNPKSVFLRADESDSSQLPAVATRDSTALRLLVFVASVVLILGLALVLTQHWGSDDLPKAQKPAARFDPPDALVANSEYVRSRVLPSGDLRVQHWIRSTRAISELTLRMPTSIRNDQAHVTAPEGHVRSKKR